ncbi:MAG TPA: NAD(P)(+) transhydrogenase (Re/Si-specific) subunit beta [Actinopolymorphaceae bacterium]
MTETVTETWADLGYLLAAICFIVALKALAAPRTARLGNLVGAFGGLLAVVLVFVSAEPDNLVAILIALAIGGLAGAIAARKVEMTAMPQLVALFNGVGGGAATLVALLEVIDLRPDDGIGLAAAGFTILIGAVSFSGSGLTFAKLQELMSSRPIVVRYAPWVMMATLVLAVVFGTLLLVNGWSGFGILLAVVALALGVLLVLPVGGADVPIVISLLNAFTGLSVAASGYLLGNTLLLVAGTLVGAAGSLLTRLMAQAMGRSVTNIMFGALRGGSTLGSTEESARPVRSAQPDDIAILLTYARKVVIVPGYGLAVAQAQHALRELVDALMARGIEVVYAIHPVAGRMPGHMNVLLAEANVPYDQLVEMDHVNPTFRQANVALVVGANDVVNPAARRQNGSPIAGMPILDVDHAESVVFLKRSMRPGFAGIENELLYDPKTTLLFGDAKDSLTKLVAAVKAL